MNPNLHLELAKIQKYRTSHLRCDLTFTHPEWSPVSIVEVVK